MKYGLFFFLALSLTVSCSSGNPQSESEEVEVTQNSQTIENDSILNHDFLSCMYGDPYFPDFLVDKCKEVLLKLCRDIEAKKPSNLEELYAISQAATEEINALQEEFYENDSEIETAARECLAADFEFIAISYGFEADIEELIATREW